MQPPLPPSSSASSTALWRERLRSRARPLLSGAALVAAFLLGLSLFGLLPARDVGAIRTLKLDVRQAVQPSALPAEATATPSHRLSLWSFPICERPASGARLYPLSLGDRPAFAVWCRSEYVLVAIDGTEAAPEVTRLARFPARGELPGGAATLDLDGDGVRDLVLGVAPALGVAHRSFSGAYWLRGRAQGGFELPRTLAETPTVALLALDLDGKPGDELALLTRGDAAAQRPGELWLFVGGTSPTRAAVIPTGLLPSDLAAVPREHESELWVVTTQPGALVRLRFGRDSQSWASPGRELLALRGAQAFVGAPRAQSTLYVRDPSDVHALESDPTPRLTPWMAQAFVGPAAWLDLERASGPLLVGATAAGFATFRSPKSGRRERALPAGVRVADVSSAAALAGAPRGLLLVEHEGQPGQLALVLLPSDLRDEATEVTLRSGPVRGAPAEARVALE